MTILLGTLLTERLCAQTAAPSVQPIVKVDSRVKFSKFLKDVHQQTGYHFVYSKEDVADKLQTFVVPMQGGVFTILDRVLTPLGLTYSVSNKYISIRLLGKGDASAEHFAAEDTESGKAFLTIVGVVTDYYGRPLVGATVLDHSRRRGTITTPTGHFSLKVDVSSKIEVSYMGYATQRLSPKGSGVVRVVMQEELNALDEIVVVGYGTQQRGNMTGAVSTVPSVRVTQARRPDMSSALTGLLSGVRTVQRGGRPGADGSYFDIRGFGNPLVIVDGVERSFTQIDPNEIESISVLKDASASVYGFKGGNGVLLLTTKKGSSKGTEVNYNFNYGVQKITDYPEYMDGVEYATYIDEAMTNVNQTPRYGSERIRAIANGTDPDYTNTDWKSRLMRTSAPMQQHNVNIDGGGQNGLRYFVSLGMTDQDGVLKTKDNYKRYNFRTNISGNIRPNLSILMQVGGHSELRDAPNSYTDAGGDGVDKFAFGVFNQLAMAIPTYGVYANDDPRYYQFINGSSINPLAIIDRDVVGTNFNRNDQLNGQVSLRYEVPSVRGLQLKAMVAYDYKGVDIKNYARAWSLYEYDKTNKSYQERVQRGVNTVEQSDLNSRMFSQQYSVEYQNVFGKHHLSGMVLWEMRRQDFDNKRIKGEVMMDNVSDLDAANATNLQTGGNSYGTAYMGVVGRFSYIYNNRYMAEFSFREDGSYKFTRDKRWGFFPAVSLGWRLSEEDFIARNTDLFDNLKVRATWGRLGDDSEADATNRNEGYLYPSVFGNFVMGVDNPVVGATHKGLINPNLTWYRVTMFNTGVDVSMWNGRFYGEIDVFYRKRTGVLARRNVSLPSIYGVTLPQENINSDHNRGVEVVMGSRLRYGDFGFDVRGSVSHTRSSTGYQEGPAVGNKYEQWRGPSISGLSSSDRNSNIVWGYTALGQFGSYDEILSSPIQDETGNTTLMPGDIKYRDVNGDGIINRLDQSPIGRSNVPEMFFGLNANVTWRSLDLTMFWQGASRYTYSLYHRQPFLHGGVGGGYKLHEDRWHRVDNADMSSSWVEGRFPPLRVEGYGGNGAASTFWNINASYLRLKVLELGWTVPCEPLRKVGVKKLRVYVSGYNLLTFKNSELKGVDPEGETGLGHFYPHMKSYNFGLNLTF